MENKTHNVIIIGGGAAGLSAALYLSRAGLAPIVFAGSPPGGQLMLTTEVENFPGQMSILGSELIDTLRKQSTKFGTTIIDENAKSVKLVESVKSVELVYPELGRRVEPVKSVKSVKSASGTEYQSKSIIIATGAKAVWMGLDSEKRLRGKGVSACATCDGFFFKNKHVAVIGGGDSALEEALTLTKFASKVYIIHRRGEFKASKIMQKRVLEHEKIEVIWNAQVQEVLGTQRVEGVRLVIASDSEAISKGIATPRQGGARNDIIKDIKVDGVFVAIGHRPDTDIFKGQVELDEKGYVITTVMYALKRLNRSESVESVKSVIPVKPAPTNSTDINFDLRYQTQTSVKGVFGAGDCVDHVYKQASTAAGMGVQAALDAERWIEGLVS